MVTSTGAPAPRCHPSFWKSCQLPEGLEYRFVNRDLVLVDLEADLIVDVLHDAVPRA